MFFLQLIISLLWSWLETSYKEYATAFSVYLLPLALGSRSEDDRAVENGLKDNIDLSSPTEIFSKSGLVGYSGSKRPPSPDEIDHLSPDENDQVSPDEVDHLI